MPENSGRGLLVPFLARFRNPEATPFVATGILGHSSTETTRIYAVPSMEMMRKAMESGNLAVDEKQQWPDDDDEMARLCGLR
jgi:hypothetical protein